MKPAEHTSILLVEDDINLSYLLLENLRSKDFDVTLKQDGREAINAVKSARFDLCLIDIMLPEVDGFSVADTLRRHAPNTPFIFLTARVQEQDKLHGFDLGADDYITKPFSFKELYCRMMVALRRKTDTDLPLAEYIIEAPALSLNTSQRILTINGVSRKLSYREAGLLQILLEHKGRFINRSEILKRIWGNDDYFTAKSMDVYLTRIRKLLKDAPHLEIENLYGTGYRILERGQA